MYRILLFLFSLFIVLVGNAQVPFSREFWLNESNTPVKVNDVFYEDNGYIWLATDEGVYSFDGKAFAKVADSATSPATALGWYEGSLMAGYKDGSLKILVKGKLVPYQLNGTTSSSAISAIRSTGVFTIITAEDGIRIAVNGKAISITTQQGLSDDFVYDALVLSDRIFFSTDRGINVLAKINGKYTIKNIGTSYGLPDNIVRTVRSIPGEPLAWVGTQEAGLAFVNTENLTVSACKMSMPWAWGQVNDILPVSRNEAWVATEENYLLKVNRYGDSIDVTPYTFEGTRFKKLLKDKAGNIWCATNYGLLLNTALYASQIRLNDFQLEKMSAMVCDSDYLWFAQENKLYRLPLNTPGNQEQVLTAPATISSLYSTGSSTLWLGTLGNGLFSYNTKSRALKEVTEITELKEGHILSIAGTGNRLWIASLNGVDETERVQSQALRLIKHHSKLSGMCSDYVYQLFADSKGNIWMATDGGGICMYNGNGYMKWDSAQGLRSEVVYSISEDNQGNIWAGTLDKALYKYDQKSWRRLPWLEGSARNTISTVKASKAGNIFVVTEEGIYQWFAEEGQLRVYNQKLGIHIDSTSTVLNLAGFDAKANLYVPFEHGFIVFPHPILPIRIKPNIRISAVSLFLTELDDWRTEFNHDENHLSFRFKGINYSNPDHIHYRYKLEGYDNNWIYTNDEVVPFAQLPARKYKFRVQASLTEDFSNAAEDSYSFEVNKPFYARIWFLILVLILLFAAGYLYIRIREHGLRKMATLQRERMIFEYEHLKSQVNPHFLFNSLNTLVNLIEDDQDAAVDYTVHLSDLYRNMLSFRDQDMIPLSEEYKIINNYMFIQQSRFGNALKLDVNIPADVLQTRKIIPLALQLLVENAIKHNVVSLSHPLTIFITATSEEITVSNAIQPKVSPEKSSGLGLINIKKRYRLLTRRDVTISVNNNQYIVTLPLL